MTRKFRFLLIAASLPMFAACADTATGPGEQRIRKDGTYDELIALGCGDLVPWGKAPCLGNY